MPARTTSFPFLAIARDFGVPYADVLAYAAHLDLDDNPAPATLAQIAIRQAHRVERDRRASGAT